MTHPKVIWIKLITLLIAYLSFRGLPKSWTSRMKPELVIIITRLIFLLVD